MENENVNLIVKEETIGSLTTNACQIRDMVKNAMDRYDVSNYSIDDIAKAKADKALLNKAQKVLNKKRIDMEKEFMAPFQEFKSVISDTCQMIKTTVVNIDTLIQKKEEQEKAAKGKDIGTIIKEMWPSILKDKDLLKHIYNPSWLNKSVSMKSIRDEITTKKASYDNDMDTLGNLKADPSVMLTYRKNFNISEAINFAVELQKKKDEEEQARKEREAQKQAEEAQKASMQNDTHDIPPETHTQAVFDESPVAIADPGQNTGDVHPYTEDVYKPEDNTDEGEKEEQRMYIITTTPAMFAHLEECMKNCNIKYSV